MSTVSEVVAPIARVAGPFLPSPFNGIAQGIVLADGILNDGSFPGVPGTIGGIGGTLRLETDGLLEEVAGVIRSTNNNIERTASDAINDVVGVLTDTNTTVNRTVRDSVRGVERSSNEAIQNITDVTDSVIHDIADVITFTNTLFGSNIDDLLGDVGGVLEAMRNVLGVELADLVDSIEDVIRGVNNKLELDTSILVDGVADILNELGVGGEDISGAIRSAADVIFKGLEDSVGAEVGGLPDAVGEQIKRILLPKDLEDKELGDALEDLAERITKSIDLDDDFCKRLFNDTLGDNPAVDLITTFLITFFSVAYLPVLIVMAKSQKCMFQWNVSNPTRILDPADIVTAMHRGIFDRDFTALQLQQHGYDRADADTIIEILKNLPDDTVTFSLWLRGLITEDDVDKILLGRGFSRELTERYKELRFFIPPVADLVTMSVREVFTPAVAERFGQFEDFPEDFAKWAAMQGVSEDWAKRYWAAHWALPSVQMGYEMLHREVIDRSDLELLLKSQDVMPFWRDKLIEISYAPFTRVDIRRMNKVGVLNEQEVNKAYRDIGYNQERADKLTEFTLELNKENNVLDVTDISELSRSNILEFFRLGIITEEVAYGMLLQIGFDVATAALWIQDVNLKEEIKERAAEAALVVAQAKSGVISFEQANDELVNMNLTSTEVLKYQRQLTTQKAEQNRLPSKTDLDKMLSSDIIAEETYRDTMAKLGYSDVWTQRYIELLGVKENEST